MKKFSRRWFLLLLMILFMVPTKSASASLWTPSKGGIYNSKDITTQDTNINIEDEDPSFVEKSLAALIRGLGNSIALIFKELGITLDGIIYGRVNGYVTTNNFSFELKPNNVYGIAGAVAYKSIRSIVLVGMAITALITYLKTLLSSGSSKANAKIRENISNYIISYGLLFLMPHIVDLLLYIRDLLLYGMSTMTSDIPFMSDTKLDLIGQYHQLAKESKSLIDAAMYLSAVIISVYYAITYIFIAVSTMILFVFFPVVALISSLTSFKIIENWFKTMYSNMIVPVVDSALMTIPLIASALGVPSFIVFVICFSLIPARGVVRGVLGGQQRAGGEMLGAGAMLMAGNMLKSGIKKGRGVADQIQDIKNDKAMGNMHSDLGQLDNAYTSMTGNTPNSWTGISNVKSGSNNSMINGIDSDYANRKSTIIGEHANKGNFENPIFKEALSNTQKADFFKERAKDKQYKLTGSVIGGTLGAGVGLGATMFNGFGGKMVGASIGESVGSLIGGTVRPLKDKGTELNEVSANEFQFKEETQKAIIDKNIIYAEDKSANKPYEFGEPLTIEEKASMQAGMNVTTSNNASVQHEVNVTSSIDNVNSIGGNEGIGKSPIDPASFTAEQYTKAIQSANGNSLEILDTVRSSMSKFQEEKGFTPHTSEFDSELLRVNANVRSQVLGRELNVINPAANTFHESETYFNIMRSKADLNELYKVYDIR